MGWPAVHSDRGNGGAGSSRYEPAATRFSLFHELVRGRIGIESPVGDRLHGAAEPRRLSAWHENFLSEPPGGNFDHLALQAPAAALLQTPLLFQKATMLENRLPKLVNPILVCGHRLHDGRCPSPLPGIETQELSKVGRRPGQCRVIRLVDNEDIGYLHDPGLDGLH